MCFSGISFIFIDGISLNLLPFESPTGKGEKSKVEVKTGEGIASIEKKRVCACTISIHFKNLCADSYEVKECRQSQREHSQDVS